MQPERSGGLFRLTHSIPVLPVPLPALDERPGATSQDGCQNSWVSASMQDRYHPKRLCLRSVSDSMGRLGVHKRVQLVVGVDLAISSKWSLRHP